MIPNQKLWQIRGKSRHNGFLSQTCWRVLYIIYSCIFSITFVQTKAEWISSILIYCAVYLCTFAVAIVGVGPWTSWFIFFVLQVPRLRQNYNQQREHTTRRQLILFAARPLTAPASLPFLHSQLPQQHRCHRQPKCAHTQETHGDVPALTHT